MISATILSNNILKRAFKEQNIEVTPMKLQKLIYLIYKSYLKKTGDSLFAEKFLAWKYGPVVQSVYDEFKTFGATHITKFARDCCGNVYIVDEDSPVFVETVEEIWCKYKKYNGIELSKMTHKPGSAWDCAKKNGLVLLDEDIKNEPDY